MEQLFPTLGKNIIHLSEVDSTNSYALKVMSKTNPIDGTVIRADNQMAGRGQIGRNWHSAPNMNLLCSIVTYPTFLLANDQFLLSKAVSIGVLEYLRELGLNDVSIKWPNDIYIKNNKVAGILIQNQITGKSIKNSVIGVGLNVNQTDWPSDLPNPISIAKITSKTFDINIVLKDLLSHITIFYKKLIFGYKDLIDQMYVKNLYLNNQQHTFYQNNKVIIGKIQGVDKTGHLIIKSLEGDLLTFRFREISFEPTSSNLR